MREKNYYIFGKNAITEALVAEQPVEKVYLSFGVPDDFTRKIYTLAKKAGVPCVTLDKGKFRHLEREHCPEGAKTQGIIALINEIESFDIKQMIDFAFSVNKNPILIALDEITDPHNLGAIART
ncbi:MAG: RNA methyltransferase substrate-binding domain-containing protein, partial [Bacteroidota bacterium]